MQKHLRENGVPRAALCFLQKVKLFPLASSEDAVSISQFVSVESFLLL